MTIIEVQIANLKLALSQRQADLVKWEQLNPTDEVKVQTSLYRKFKKYSRKPSKGNKQAFKRTLKAYRRNGNAVFFRQVTVQDKMDKCNRDIVSLTAKIDLLN